MSRFSDFKHLDTIVGNELLLVAGTGDSYNITVNDLLGLSRLVYKGKLESIDDLPKLTDAAYGDTYAIGTRIWALLSNADGVEWVGFGAGDVSDTTDDTTPQVRLAGKWIDIPVNDVEDDSEYLRVKGEWKKFRIDNFNLSIKRSINGTFDAATGNCWIINAESDLTVTFENLAANRYQEFNIVVEGNTSNITWPSDLNWSGGSAPVLGEVYTVILVTWDGSRLTGSVKQYV